MCHPTFTDKKVRRPSVAIRFATTLTPFVKPCEVLRGYLDVAIAKIRETCMQSCDKDSQTCSFANFSQWLHLNNLAKKLSVKLAKNGRKNIWSVKVGCTILTATVSNLVDGKVWTYFTLAVFSAARLTHISCKNVLMWSKVWDDLVVWRSEGSTHDINMKAKWMVDDNC